MILDGKGWVDFRAVKQAVSLAILRHSQIPGLRRRGDGLQGRYPPSERTRGLLPRPPEPEYLSLFCLPAARQCLGFCGRPGKVLDSRGGATPLI